jgi:hypothetical protein
MKMRFLASAVALVAWFSSPALAQLAQGETSVSRGSAE